MKILVVDHFRDYMKDHIDWFHQFLLEGNIIISRHDAIDTDPVAWWGKDEILQEQKDLEKEYAKYHEDYLWYQLLQDVDPTHFINFNEESGYPTHLEMVPVKEKIEVKECPFPGIAYDPTAKVSHLQKLFHFISKIYPEATLANMYFVGEEEDFFKEVKQAKGHCYRIFHPKDFQSVIESNFFKKYEKEKDKITSTLLPKVNLDGVWSANVLFTTVEGILEGTRMYEEEPDLENVKKRLTQYVLDGNILVLFTTLQQLPARELEKLYSLLDEILMTTSYSSVFLFQRDLAGWQLGTRSRFANDPTFTENEFVQKMVGDNESFLPFGWHEEKREVLKPFLATLKMHGIYIKEIFAVGENVMEDASLLEQVKNMRGTASFVIPGEDPGESLVQSTKRYDHLDKAHVDQFSTYLEGSVKSFEIFMDQYVFKIDEEPKKS